MSEQITVKSLPCTYVGSKIARQRVINYLQTKEPLLTNNLGKPETRTIWYTFRQIEEIYHEMVFQKADGLRLYLGAYEQESEFAGQLCLLMVLTRLNSQTYKHEDIILENEPGFSSRLAETFDSTQKVKDHNYGSPCPPVCGEHDMRYP